MCRELQGLQSRQHTESGPLYLNCTHGPHPEELEKYTHLSPLKQQEEIGRRDSQLSPQLLLTSKGVVSS